MQSKTRNGQQTELPLDNRAREVKIAPSILASDLSNIALEIEKLAAAKADLIHLDIMDGHYVPNLSFGVPVIERIANLTNIPLDAHLMVLNPEIYLEPLAKVGVKYISYHPETVYHNHRFINMIKKKGIKAGWAINPGTSETIIEPLLDDLDFVLLMSVNPGFSGQKFIPNVYDKIKNVRTMTKDRQDFEIEVDGGVNGSNAAELIRCGTDILVAGSYIFQTNDYSLTIGSLRNVK